MSGTLVSRSYGNSGPLLDGDRFVAWGIERLQHEIRGCRHGFHIKDRLHDRWAVTGHQCNSLVVVLGWLTLGCPDVPEHHLGDIVSSLGVLLANHLHRTGGWLRDALVELHVRDDQHRRGHLISREIVLERTPQHQTKNGFKIRGHVPRDS